MKYVLKLDSLLASCERRLLVALLFVMVGLSFVQVVLRIGFSSGILWADPLLRYLVLWAGFMGAALASRSRKHFALDIVPRLMPERFKKCAVIVNTLFAMAVAGLLCWASVKFLRDEISSGAVLFSIGLKNIPASWLEFMIPLGFLLITFHYAVSLFGGEGAE